MAAFIKPFPGMRITEDVTFMPGVYNFYNLEGIIIDGNHITIDGSYALFVGGKELEKQEVDIDTSEFSYGYSDKKYNANLPYKGIGIRSVKTRGVTIKNLSCRGFKIGLSLDNCENWHIEACDFSMNYHHPEHGWDDHDDLGGVVLTNSQKCVLQNNKANQVWNALTLRHSNENLIVNNNFSYTSNVGLRMWQSSHNKIYDNNFSHGLRKKPNEIHARDSSCVLVETKSCHNHFKGNDMRYGGDGFFIRSLNNLMSTDNIIEENDMSFSNNNAIEAWDEGNIYIRNKANASSYGFWLGNSDNTTLIENEVAFNGCTFKNAPEAFGNAGIAVVNGSGTNFKVIGNHIHDNSGPGLAIKNKSYYPSQNWLIKDNQFIRNRDDQRGYLGHGIYMKYVQNIHLINNIFEANDGRDVYQDKACSEVIIETKDKILVDFEIKKVKKIFQVEESIILSTTTNYPVVWYIDGKKIKGNLIDYSFDEPGLKRIGAKIEHKDYCGIASTHLYVMPQGESFSNKMISGTHIALLLRIEDDYIEWYQTSEEPRIELSGQGTCLLKPKKGFYEHCNSIMNEYKYDLLYIEVNLEDDPHFDVVSDGKSNYNKYKIITDRAGVQIEDIVLFSKKPKDSSMMYGIESVRTSCNDELKYKPLDKQIETYDKSHYWLSEDKSYYQVNFKTPRYIDSIEYEFLDNITTDRLISFPEHAEVELIGANTSYNLDGKRKRLVINRIEVEGLRLHVSSKDAGLKYLNCFDSHAYLVDIESNNKVKVESLDVMLAYNNGDNGQVSDLIVEIIEDGMTLVSTEVEYGQVEFMKPINLPLAFEYLPKRDYMVTMTQKEIQEDQSGKFYRWCSNKIGPMNGQYGFISNDKIIDSGRLGWGNMWYRLHTKEGLFDKSFEDELVGNRIGIKEMEVLFQKLDMTGYHTGLTYNTKSSELRRGKYTLKCHPNTSKIVMFGKGEVTINNETYMIDEKLEVSVKETVLDLSIINEGYISDIRTF
ncbi:hypothetical protein EZV73_21340 [Acidaminobacter sp. JC074]|uniref:right-handed parallel beta-helix repeat-containing protein n=1 Tax=Acidaminobacter sp. JC074 TaxID=2530199 RepID=UPI001F101829|nr:right-handed parallel beta-helix repeat-containing protein [Acidaminobacter sp. JC074]MCH4890139.1 hypothetical protein [Acidaminobacter sp. JC074]